MRHNTDVDISKVKKDLEILRNDVAKITNTLLHEKQDNAKRFTEGILQSLISEGQSIANGAKSAGNQAVKAVSNSSHHAIEEVEGKIHKRPFLSMMLSFVFGMVIAEIFERR